MIPVQLCHRTFNNNLNQQCDEIIQRHDQDAPDRYWIMTHVDQLFTYGTQEVDEALAPSHINGIVLQPMDRSGAITYHGPGQISWGWLINYRRLRRLYDAFHHDPFSFNILLQLFRNILNDRFNETLVSNPGDPGIYRRNREKILSFGADARHTGWIVVKASLNLCVDLDVYAGTTICGVRDRPMGNLLSNKIDVAEQHALGEELVRMLWSNIYEHYSEQPWAE